MKTLILNSTNIVPNGQNNQLVYRFPNSVTFRNQEIAFASATLYNSWENINVTLQNNTFSYNWINALGVATTYPIVIPSGTYEISALNAYLQFVFIQNNHYLVNASGDNVYYAELLVNPERYAVQINTFLFPTALPAGWSNPAAVPFPPQPFNPIITLPAKINELLGYTVGFATDQNLNNAFVPPVSPYVSKLANGTLSYISTTYPNVNPNPSILFSLTNLDNSYATPSSILYTLSPSVGVGQLISEKVPEYAWMKLFNGTVSELRLTILGSDLSPIALKDPSMTIVLVIKDANTLAMK